MQKREMGKQIGYVKKEKRAKNKKTGNLQVSQEPPKDNPQMFYY